jgi:hypothetical protein
MLRSRLGFAVPMAALALAGTPQAPQAPRQGAAPPRGYSIPIIDLSADVGRQTVVDREAGQYLGHPTTVLLFDRRAAQ